MTPDDFADAKAINHGQSPGEGLERVLKLAQRERNLRNSPQWKSDMETAMDAHGEAVENLYAELYRLLDARRSIGNEVEAHRLPPDPRKELKRQIVARLKAELPAMVASVIDEF